jgi:hypothetical protein
MNRTIEEIYNLKPLKDILKLPTKRLLNCYKIERKHSYGYRCGCCGEWLWIVQDLPHLKEEYAAFEIRLEALKKELSNREHIPVKVKKSKKIFLGNRLRKFRKQEYLRIRQIDKDLAIDRAKEELKSYFKNMYANRKK